MPNATRPKFSVNAFAELLQEHPLIRLAGAIAVPIAMLGGITQLIDWADREPKATLDVGSPTVEVEHSLSPNSKHIRLPITALYQGVNHVEAKVMHSDPRIQVNGTEDLFFAREYEPHNHGDPEEENWTPQRKLQHLKDKHFKYADPIDLAIDEKVKVNVVVTIEGWDTKMFLGNDTMDELPHSDTISFTVKVTAKNADSKTVTFTVVNALSYAKIHIAQPHQRASSWRWPGAD